MINCGLIAQALEAHDAEAAAPKVEIAEAQRAEVLERFPPSGWPEMTLEQYALGQRDQRDNFCRWMEFEATELGSIKGGSAHKHHIYLQQAEQRWWFEEDRYATVEEAWAAVRAGFVEALSRADEGAWEDIDRIPALKGGPALLTKTLHLYFPDELLPIFSHAHLSHFLTALGDERRSFDDVGTVALNRRLLAGLRDCGELQGWSTKEIERLLYESDFNPFDKDEQRSPIGDVPRFVAETIERYGEAGIEARRGAEDQARALLDANAGGMEERQLRELFGHFNTDSHLGKPSQSRFSPAFVGASANRLVENLAAVNEWTGQLWGETVDEILVAADELLADRKLLPFSGTSYPTMLMYLGDPERFAVWLQSTDRGLQRLRSSYQPKRTPGEGKLGDYLEFCRVATELMRDHEIPAELLDAVLAAASREADPPPAAEPDGARVWIFQANPAVLDIDRALSEEPQMSWVVRQYRKEVHEGDRVYLWRSGGEAGVIAVATVLTDPAELPGIGDSPYLLKPEALSKPEPRVELRIERVLSTPLRRSELLEHPVLKDLGVIAFANATNFEVTAAQDAELRTLIDPPTVLEVPAVRAGLAEELHLPQEFLANLTEMLAEKQQLILYGPPGTGKTRIALELGEELTRDGGAVEVVQFHPSYAYEDFVGGFRPLEDDSATGIRYARVDGPLRRIAAAAAADPARPYVLIVDEINRGNIPKVFGELLFLLEYRRRAVRLQYWPDEPFSLPANLFLIGTMNTADRSIALVDAALRRRFYFVELSPVKAPVKEVLRSWLREHGLDEEPALLLDRLNREMAADDFAIGPSYFLSGDGAAPDLERIWEREIMPLLHEHYYGTDWDPARFSLGALRALAEPAPP